MKTCGDCRNFRPVFALRSNTKGECLKGHMADRSYMQACKAHFEPKEAVGSADDTVGALRQLSVETGSLACMGCGREHNCGTHGCAILRASTDLHEQQQAHIAELEQQLAASRREKQAAVEDMEKCMHYASPKNNNLCNFCLKDMAEYPQKCGGWEDAAKCCPKWRGPQEAGKGDSDA